jgi:polysaccharide deacetylase 2 family uncharacterized protein YibQ
MPGTSLHQQSSQFFRSNWAPVLIGGLLVCGLFIGRMLTVGHSDHAKSPADYRPSRAAIQQMVRSVLTAHEVTWKEQRPGSDKIEQWHISIPADLPEIDLLVSIQREIKGIGVSVLRSRSDPVSDFVIWDIGSADSATLSLRFIQSDQKRSLGKIAILIDDFGDRSDALAYSFLDLDANLSISIIPGLPRSKQITSEAMARGHEIVLHLPMEPVDGSYPDHGYTLITEMSQEQVTDVFRKAYKLLPGIKGVNNHMGSKITTDRRIMGYLMTAIKPYNLYYLDSRTIATTVAYETAMANGVRCAERDVFLDTNQDKESIRKSMSELAEKAETNGTAIGIGHCHPNTLDVLREEIPRLEERGFRLIRLSEAMN